MSDKCEYAIVTTEMKVITRYTVPVLANGQYDDLASVVKDAVDSDTVYGDEEVVDVS